MRLNIDRAKVEVPYKTRWWGTDCICDPRFVEACLGDGMVLLGFQPLNTRPNYYVIRIDSSWHLHGCRSCKDRCPDEVTEHLDEIYEAIQDEYDSVENVRYYNEEEDLQDRETDSEEWPVMSADSGSCWFTLDPEKYVAATEQPLNTEKQ